MLFSVQKKRIESKGAEPGLITIARHHKVPNAERSSLSDAHPTAAHVLPVKRSQSDIA